MLMGAIVISDDHFAVAAAIELRLYLDLIE